MARGAQSMAAPLCALPEVHLFMQKLGIHLLL
jgi:hypothetical protein